MLSSLGLDRLLLDVFRRLLFPFRGGIACNGLWEKRFVKEKQALRVKGKLETS